ncbi:uncharacterized conserved protein [Zymobacter palmae]|uniref:Uncharacterized conserved protein n=1 Tax=Zymobacter palmae TaxID=33074 RepID=A0A348HD19_9GAMM|nr:uncharacterized conserved protein [Zymobacter palmae]
MQRMHAAFAQLPLQPKREVRRVDTDHDISPPCQSSLTQLTPHAEEPWQMAHHLNQPHHGQRFQREKTLHALSNHSGATNAFEGNLWMADFERVQQATAKDIAREFARNDEHLERRGSNGLSHG